MVFGWRNEDGAMQLLGARNDAVGGAASFELNFGESDRVPQGRGLQAALAAQFTHGPRGRGPRGGAAPKRTLLRAGPHEQATETTEERRPPP